VKISADRLLLVEGRDEVGLFEALIEHCVGDELEVQVIAAGGVNKFSKNIRAISVAARSRATLCSIAVVRDADEDARGAFQSACAHLRNAGYVPPLNHAEFSDAAPSVGVFIVPDGLGRGAMETLCRRSVEGTNAALCVDEYLDCLERHDAMRSRNSDKSFAHAYLATMEDPVARVGEGARQGVWNLESPAFAALSRFLRDFFQRGA
jgi:hypothetical protein